MSQANLLFSKIIVMYVPSYSASHPEDILILTNENPTTTV